MKHVPHHLTTSEQDYQALEALVIDNPDLERLEMLLDNFNMFDAIGAIWQEPRHSDLLAFLLNPQRNHGLGDSFLKRLLQKALLSAYDEVHIPVSAIDFDVWDMNQVIVLRDSQRVDILLLDERHRLAVIVENKLTGRGNAQQLQHYWETVRKLYHGWSIIGLYLTPDGDPAPDRQYLSVDYGLVCSLIERLVDSRATTLNSDVGTMLIHYTEMLRRHIVGESEITRLCRRIYGRHQRAFDLIYEHRLSRQKVIRNVTKLLIEQKQGLILDHTQERYTGFAVQEWDVPSLMDIKSGDRPRSVLLFEFDTWLDTLPLRLHISAGTDEVRHRLIDMTSTNQPPFKIEDSLSPETEWISVFERRFLTPEFYEEATTDELADNILQNWADFLKTDLPALDGVLRRQEWVWRAAK